jgi:hypothetical protein
MSAAAGQGRGAPAFAKAPAGLAGAAKRVGGSWRRPEKPPSGACLTMTAPVRVIRRPARDRLDNEVACDAWDESGTSADGDACRRFFRTDPPSLKLRRAGAAACPHRAAPLTCRGRRACGCRGSNTRVTAAKACRRGGAMRTGRCSPVTITGRGRKPRRRRSHPRSQGFATDGAANPDADPDQRKAYDHPQRTRAS